MIARIALVASLTASSTLGASREPYEGPAGLRWGMSPDEVSTAWASKFTAVDTPLAAPGFTAQVWTGEFAGERVEGIVTAFLDDSLAAVMVAYPSNDQRPATRRWMDIVEQMREAYGQPESMTDPPDKALSNELKKSKSRKAQKYARLAESVLAGTRFDALDLMAIKGEWTPSAKWRFPGGAQVQVIVQVNSADESGMRTVSPLWRFESKRFLDARTAGAAKRDY